MFLIVIALTLNGCARDATAEDSTVTTTTETQNETRTNSASGDIVWIAIVTRWQPIKRTIDKEFISEVNCWNYYESGLGESKFGVQHLDHQGNKPGKGFHFGPNHLNYPTRTYNGKGEEGHVWLSCDIKGKYQGL